MILLILASQVARITDVSHRYPAPKTGYILSLLPNKYYLTSTNFANIMETKVPLNMYRDIPQKIQFYISLSYRKCVDSYPYLN
jgi:hypothetical protein